MYGRTLSVCSDCIKRHSLVNARRELHRQLYSHGGARSNYSRKLLSRHDRVHAVAQVRQIGLLVRAIQGVMKIRYLLIGSALGGGVALNKVRFVNHLDLLVNALH